MHASWPRAPVAANRWLISRRSSPSRYPSAPRVASNAARCERVDPEHAASEPHGQIAGGSSTPAADVQDETSGGDPRAPGEGENLVGREQALLPDLRIAVRQGGGRRAGAPQGVVEP